MPISISIFYKQIGAFTDVIACLYTVSIIILLVEISRDRNKAIEVIFFLLFT